MKNLTLIIFGSIFFTFFSSCSVVRQDEVGVKRRLGRLKEKVLPPGIYTFNPLFTRMLKIPIRTMNMQIELEALPSKEGLTIRAELAILYHVKSEMAVDILKKVGKPRLGEQIILSVLRSAAADVTAKFYAKDMHTSEREVIEKEIANKMMNILGERGFVIENVLLKSIRLPAGLSRAIEEKLAAEQEAQRMEFVLSREKREAERKRIEAEGIRDAQKIISEGLNQLLIQYRSLEVMERLSTSPNTKIIITDGRTPYLINPENQPSVTPAVDNITPVPSTPPKK